MLTLTIYGLLLGGIYALVSVGFVLVASATRTINMGHGAIAMIGTYTFVEVFGSSKSILLAAITVIAVMIALSIAVALLIFIPLHEHHFSALLGGVALALLLESIAVIRFYGGQSMAYPTALRLKGNIHLGSTTIDPNQVLALGIVVVAVVALDRFLQKASLGMEMRAISDDHTAAALCGVSVRRVTMVAFAIAGLAAGVAGVLLGLVLPTIDPYVGDKVLLPALAAALLGGMVSMRGAVAGAMLIGLAQSISIRYFPSTYAATISFAVAIVVLIIKPHGIFGEKGRIA